MHPRILTIGVLFMATLFSCGDKAEEEEPGDEGGWFDEDDGSDEDSGGAEGGDPGGETGTEGTEHPEPYAGIDCADGLAFLAQSRDAEGYCTICTGEVNLYAVVYNPCEEALSFETTDGMVVGSVFLDGPGGGDGGGSSGGGGEPMEIEVGGGEVWEEYLMGAPYPDGTWTLEVGFNDTEDHEAVHEFKVIENSGGGSGGSGGSGTTGGGSGSGSSSDEGGGDDSGDGDDGEG